MKGSRLLLSKEHINNLDIASYYKSLSGGATAMRSAYHGPNPTKEMELMDNLDNERLGIIKELENDSPLSTGARDNIKKTLENLLLIANMEKKSGTFEGTTAGIDEYLTKLYD